MAKGDGAGDHRTAEEGLRWSKSEMMIVASARQLAGGGVCFVGIGLPNIVCNLAKHTVAPRLDLVYESGVFGAAPRRLPLSIGDPTLVSGSTAVCSMFELFAFYLQAGRVDVGFLGAAQIDRFGNINTTVIGDYHRPKTRLPGGGGAPEIAVACGEIFIIMRQAPRSFVDKLDFVTSFGHGQGGDERARIGIKTKGPTKLVTDLAIFEPDPQSKEMTVVSIHPGVTREQIKDNTGWPVRYAATVTETPAPTDRELAVLRELHAKTARAHGDAA
ncbi:MAG: CoA-transferase subunit beta [Burkholderiales bacterium]